MNPFISALSLIIHVIFDTYIILLLLRLILQKLGANWHNPISQFVIKLTQKPLIPLRKIIPRFQGFDLSIIVLAFIIQVVAIILSILLQFGTMPNVAGILLLSIGGLLSKTIYIYIYAVIIDAIASWIPTLQAHPLMHITHIITRPLLNRARQTIPLVSGVDLSPMLILLILIVLNILITTPLLNIGTHLAIS